MHEFKDPSGLTRSAINGMFIYLAGETLLSLATFHASIYGLDDWQFGLVMFDLMIIYLMGPVVQLVLVFSVIMVGRWIYRVSANAHAISDELTISPGWSVGWYFVPVANLFMPFRAMKEVWLASHSRGNWGDEPALALLGWWWGLWIVTNIIDIMWLRLFLDEGIGSAKLSVMFDLGFAGAMLNVPLCLVLASIMRRVAAVQSTAFQKAAFA